ncbi:helix-turn-helix domain-containing protein [Rhodopirellula sallentina]|uniref:Transcriptional regulatory protein n=1 Tax=Rhodopirellula sallentina SM41 TaxID=1263870 RepID=M5U3Q5_9BACT|nr:transcriptional regulator [Rhodopirellula sallentina]EMI56085.1 transcriptional regulatory protein [Rhodopirellula sallentina SM41]
MSSSKPTTVSSSYRTTRLIELPETVALCDEEIRQDVRVLRERGDFDIFQRCVDGEAVPEALSDHLDSLELNASVSVSTNDRVLLGYNAVAARNCSLEPAMLGRRLPRLQSGSIRQLDETTDKVLLGGARIVWFEHDSPSPDGSWYRWSTLKMAVLGFQKVAFCLLSLSRPVMRLANESAAPGRLLNEQLVVYQQLDEIDRQICQGIAVGDSTGEIATSVGLTRRSIEVRRAKILEHFGFSRQVQIVRLLVRLEENGLLPD